jgi:hypothetical protein
MELEIIQPRPLSLEPVQPRPISVKGAREWDGPTQSDVLLHAIVVTARKPLTVATKSALRVLISRFNHECGLDF